MEFEVKSLRSLTNLITKGTTPSNIGESFTDEGVMYFRSELVGRGKYIDKSSGLLFISEETHKKLKRSHIKTGDLLFSMAGAYLGKISLVSDEDVPSNTNQAVAIVRFKPGSCNVEYAYYFMTQKWFTDYVYSFNAQAAQPNINLEQIGKLKIALPSLHLQNRVVAILSAYDRLIATNNKRIKVLEQMAENLYKEWFIRFRFPGHETAEFENGIPKGWEIASVKETFEIFDTKRVPLSSLEREGMQKLYPYYGAAELMDYVEDYLFDGIYLLFGEDGSVMTPTGKPMLQYVWGKFWVNNHAHVLQGKAPFSTEFIYLMFKNTDVAGIVTGSAQPKISQARLFKKKTIIPSHRIVETFNNIITPLFENLRLLTERNKNLVRQRDLLLPRLMSGKLEVVS